MSNFVDYIDWRGDLDFISSPFNQIDALILCQISYLNFNGILLNYDFESGKDLKTLSSDFKNSIDFETRSDLGVLINKKTADFFIKVASSKRFRNVCATGYVSIYNKEKEEQFSAMSYLIDDKTVFVSYRGTDDTIIGWKEDFNLAIKEPVPAQIDSVEYLEKAAAKIKRNIIVGGHSKGGNLALYACTNSSKKVKNRLVKIYNFDGPGFQKDFIESENFKEILPLINSFYPEFSIVGQIFYHEGKYSIVESNRRGIMQHDPFSWHLIGKKFILCDKFDSASNFFNEAFNEWILNLEPNERETFVDTFFQVIEATDAETNSEIEANFLKNSTKIIAKIRKLDPKLRSNMYGMINALFKTAFTQFLGIKNQTEKSNKE